MNGIEWEYLWRADIELGGFAQWRKVHIIGAHDVPLDCGNVNYECQLLHNTIWI